MLSSNKTPQELRDLRAGVEKSHPRRTLWRSNTRGTLCRVTGCSLEADTYVPRIQFVSSGSTGPSFNLTIDQFNNEFEIYRGMGVSHVVPD